MDENGAVGQGLLLADEKTDAAVVQMGLVAFVFLLSALDRLLMGQVLLELEVDGLQ